MNLNHLSWFWCVLVLTCWQIHETEFCYITCMCEELTFQPGCRVRRLGSSGNQMCAGAQKPYPTGWERTPALVCFPEHRCLHLLPRPRGLNCSLSTMATSWIPAVFLSKHPEVRPSRHVGSFFFYRGLSS